MDAASSGQAWAAGGRSHRVLNLGQPGRSQHSCQFHGAFRQSAREQFSGHILACAEPEFYALVRDTHYDPGNGYAIMALTDAQSTADITTVLAAGETAKGWMAFDVPRQHGYIKYAPNSNGQPVAEWKY